MNEGEVLLRICLYTDSGYCYSTEHKMSTVDTVDALMDKITAEYAGCNVDFAIVEEWE